MNPQTRRRFRLTREQHDLPIGTLVHEWWGHDFGCVRDDAMEGLETYAVSEEPGEHPFFTCEVDALEPIDGLPPVRGNYTVSAPPNTVSDAPCEPQEAS